MDAFRPRLRPEVTLSQQPDGTLALVDRVMNRGIALDHAGVAIARRLDGTHTVDELFAAVADAAPRATLEQALRGLLLVNAVEGAGDDIAERMRALSAGEAEYGARVLPEARFACQGSGECCRGYSFGPLTEGDLTRLAGLDIAGTYPHLGPGPYTTERDGKHYLRKNGEACMFVLPDQRCSLHAAFGADSKPAFCRLYPIRITPTLAGLKMYDNGECATFAVSSSAGRPLTEEVPRLRALLPPGRLHIHHPMVELREGVVCDYGHYERLEAILCEVAAQAPDTGIALRVIGHLAQRFIDRVSSCALAAGEPDQTINDAMSEPISLEAAPDPRALTRVGTVTALLERAARDEAATQPSAIATVLLGHLADALARVHGAVRSGRPPAPPPAGMDDMLRRSLRYLLFSQRALIDGRLRPALLRIALTHLVVLAGSRGDLSFAHMVAMRTLRMGFARRLFHAYADDAFAALDAASTIWPSIH